MFETKIDIVSYYNINLSVNYRVRRLTSISCSIWGGMLHYILSILYLHWWIFCTDIYSHDRHSGIMINMPIRNLIDEWKFYREDLYGL